MTTINCYTNDTMYSRNWGQHCERALAYALTGEFRPHGNAPYYMDSDIPEYELSVKSSGFTLMSGTMCKAQDFEGIISEYMENTASKKVAYVDYSMTAYIMSLDQFNEFLHRFCYLDRESGSDRKKVRMRKESKKVLAWLTAQAVG